MNPVRDDPFMIYNLDLKNNNRQHVLVVHVITVPLETAIACEQQSVSNGTYL